MDYTLMTLEICGSFCLKRGHLIFGAEYGGECYCGDALDITSTLALDEDCSMECAGDHDETCGASNRLSVYEWQ